MVLVLVGFISMEEMEKKSTPEEVKDLLGIPKKYNVLNCVCLGIKKKIKNEKNFEFHNKIHYEKY